MPPIIVLKFRSFLFQSYFSLLFWSDMSIEIFFQSKNVIWQLTENESHANMNMLHNKTLPLTAHTQFGMFFA